jgi:TnpA family transposase
MAHRTILTERQRAALFDLPTSEPALLHHYTLADDDLEHIRLRRRPQNRLGFALQLCAFRHPGRLLTTEEIIPEKVIRFIAAQLGTQAAELEGYAVREETRRDHLIELRAIYGYKMMSDNHLGRCRQPPWPVGLDGRRACPSGGQPHRPD